MDHLFPAAGAVNGGCLIELNIHRGKRRHIDDTVPAKSLPDVGYHIDSPKIFWLGHKRNRFAAHDLPNSVDKSIAGYKGQNHAANYHHRDEVRHIDNSLDRLFKPLRAKLIEQQRKDDRRRKAKN